MPAVTDGSVLCTAAGSQHPAVTSHRASRGDRLQSPPPPSCLAGRQRAGWQAGGRRHLVCRRPLDRQSEHGRHGGDRIAPNRGGCRTAPPQRARRTGRCRRRRDDTGGRRGRGGVSSGGHVRRRHGQRRLGGGSCGGQPEIDTQRGEAHRSQSAAARRGSRGGTSARCGRARAPSSARRLQLSLTGRRS